MSTTTNPLANCTSKEEVLAKVASGEASVEQASAWMDEQHRKKYKLRFQVAEKGGISVYGLNVRFPVTQYPEQWIALLDAADELRTFMAKPETQAKCKANQAQAKAAKAAAKAAA